MPSEIDRQAIADEEHLNALRWGYIVAGCWAAFMSGIGLIYALMGVVFARLPIPLPPPTGQPQAPPPLALFKWFFLVFGLAWFVVAASFALGRFWTARCLHRRRSRTFCMVVAAIGCLEIPYGTALGVFTFLILGRASVVKLFEAPELSTGPAFL